MRENFLPLCPAVIKFFLNSVQLWVTPEASCFPSAHLVSSPIVLSVNIVVVALSPGLLSFYLGAFFPKWMKVKFGSLLGQSNCYWFRKIFSFGLCIHSVMSPEKFGIPQFAMTSDAVPYLLAVNWHCLGHFAWLNGTVCAILLWFSDSLNVLCGLSKWKDISIQIFKKSLSIKSKGEQIQLIRGQTKNFLQLFQSHKEDGWFGSPRLQCLLWADEQFKFLL